MGDFLGDTMDWFKGIWNSAGDQVGEWSDEWEKTVANFKAQAREFMRVFESLKADKDVAESDPVLKNQYDKLMNRGNWIYETIRSIASKIDWAMNSTFGSKLSGMNGMGALPLVPVAVIAGAVAVMTAWLADAYSVRQKLDTAKELTGQGVSGSDLSDIIHGKPLLNVGGNFQNLFYAGLVGLVIYMAWPEIQRRLK